MAAPETVVNIPAKFKRFSDVYSPRIIAAFNDYHFKVARLHGPFDWHIHDDTDEVFLVISGSVRIHVVGRDPAVLQEGDLYVVPRGVEHRPVADDECHVLLIEPSGTPNTGDTATATEETWV